MPVDSGVTLWSAEVGPYVWHDFDAERLRAEVRGVAVTGLRTLRVLLPWDVFMPAPTRVPDARLRQFELLLQLAATQELGVVPVLFAQSLGDCVMLPPYAIDVGGRRAGVRVLSNAVVQPGAPRDQHTDPLLLEAQLGWLHSMLQSFAGHPALKMWDLGHDPAATMRPRRIEQQQLWCRQLADVVHAHGERCMLTLAAADIIEARGVRPGVLAPCLDALGFVVQSDVADGFEVRSRAGRVLFLTQLLAALSGGATPLWVHLGAPLPDFERAAQLAQDCTAALLDAGAAAVLGLWWSETGPRTASVAPFDRAPDLARRGLVDVHGERTAFGAAFITQLSRDIERRALQPWPSAMDVEDYYANLPESLLDLQRGWKAASGGAPAMLE
jgi:hypothetical protein